MIATLVGVTRGTVATAMTAYKVHGKTTSAKHNSDRQTKLTDRDRKVLKRIVAFQSKTTATKVTTKLNTHFKNAVST